MRGVRPPAWELSPFSPWAKASSPSSASAFSTATGGDRRTVGRLLHFLSISRGAVMGKAGPGAGRESADGRGDAPTAQCSAPNTQDY